METTTKYPSRLRKAVFGVILVTACLAGTHGANGEVINSCVTYCHSLPPSDGPRKGSTVDTPTNATFQGNHATHAVSSATSCAKCHPGSASYTFGHMTAAAKPVIKLGSNINNSPSGGQYLKGGVPTVFSNQTTVPILGNCSNVNCHFGSASDTWGSTPYAGATTANCAKCHGAPPATGNHAKHFQSFGATVSACASCHPNHAGEGAPFRHATSASPGGRNLSVSFTSAPGGTGSYAAGTHVLYPNYLSSSTGYGTCSGLYCHGSSTPQWGGAALQCNSCHGASNNGDLSTGTTAGHAIHYNTATVFTNISGGNATTAGAYAFACKNCHPTNSHANGPANALSSAQIGGTSLSAGQYSAGGASSTDARGFKYTTGTCSLNSCHGNGQGGAPLATVSWGAAATGTCVQCHDTKQTGATATQLSGKHDKHLNSNNNAIMGAGNGFNCVDCHAKTVSGNTTISDRTRHVNGLVDYSGARAGGSARYSAATKQCSNIYCHSDGNPGALVFVSMTGTKAWNATATFSCNGCHGRTNSLGAPDYANGGAAPAASANSHAKHVAGAASTTICATCHNKTASATVASRFKDYTASSYHLNRTPNVFFDTSQAGSTASFNASTGVCSNVNCHGGTGSSATWGATLNCQDCHGNGASASTSDFGATFWNNGTMSKVQMTGTGSWAGNGHGLASGTYAGSGYPAANFGVQTRQCEFCHDSTVAHKLAANPFRLLNFSTASFGRNAPCLVCHSASGAGVTVNGTLIKRTSSPAVEAYHYGAKHGATLSGGRFCWDCHDPHGTGNTNQFMIRANPAVVSDRTTSAPTTQSATAVAFTLSATPTGTDFAKSAAPFNGVCNVCHTTTSHYTQTSGDSHNSGTACTGCHLHNGVGGNTATAFTPAAGDCTTCHASQQGTGTRKVVGADTTLLSHHIQGTPLNAASCTVCHEQATFGHQVAGDVAVGMFNQDTGASLAYDGTTATASNLETSCNSCHDLNGATRLGANAMKPFTDSGDNTAPPFIGWSTGKQAHGANMACFNCHGNSAGVAGNTLTPKYNGHGSATAKMLQFAYNAADAMTTATNFCYNCHGTTTAGGVTSPSIQAAVNLSASIGHKSASCSACHDQHSAKPGTHTIGPSSPIAPVLNGVAGVGGWPATSPATAATWNGTGTLAVTYTAKPAATNEFEICFKCHANTVPAPTGYTAGAMRMTDLALEFNPANKSGHPVVANLNGFTGSTAPKALLASDMVAPWTAVGTQTMTCSDCHNRPGTGAMGPHGSSVRWMLTGTNQAWPFTTTAGNGASSGTPWQLGTLTTGTAPNTLFCRNCHVITTTNGVHDALMTGGRHSSWASTARGACLSCHIRIPHGGKVSRLIRPGTAAALGRYAPDGNGAEVGTSTQQLMSKFTKGTQTSNRRGSWTGVGCTEHTGGTETW